MGGGGGGVVGGTYTRDTVNPNPSGDTTGAARPPRSDNSMGTHTNGPLR